MRKQQRDMNAGVTEDDLNEIKQDISGLRFELLEIFKKNDYRVDIRENPAGNLNFFEFLKLAVVYIYFVFFHS